MKIAIHISKGDFSERWVEYCREHSIPWKQVNCYDSDIIDQLNDCDALMWHHNHVYPEDVLFARQLLFSLEQSGKKVFPDFRTAWHFDDKLGQKYLLEAAGIPMAPSYAFFSKRDAIRWINHTDFPKVFKLRGGAGSKNVRLISNRNEAIALARKAFGRGFRQYDAYSAVKEQFRKYRLNKATVKDVLKAVAHILYPVKVERSKGREKGYLYFQDFIPGNKADYRVIVIGDKAFAIKRMVRKDDFRASGSGHIVYDRNEIDPGCVRHAFSLNEKLKAQCIACDFVLGSGNTPLVVEVSYGFMARAYDQCPGYWDQQLNWHEGSFNPYGWMVENLIKN